ncbi:MAG: hypothetical protein R3D84_13900 [Paracoccaceae bacterium]
MSEISDYERRITYALERISRGLEAMAAEPGAVSAVSTSGDAQTLREALEAERDSNAQLIERVRAIKEKQETTVAALERRIESQTRQLDVQGLEMQRMKKTTIQLRETVRALREGLEQGVAEPHLINKAMLAELEALRAARTADVAEMDEILEGLRPLLEEENDG